LVASFEEKGWVDRDHDPNDSRSYLLVLIGEAGRAGTRAGEEP